MAPWAREVTVVPQQWNLVEICPQGLWESCSWKGVSLEKLCCSGYVRWGSCCWPLVTTSFHALQEMGNREDWSAAGACQAETLEPERKPLSNCNMFRWDQRISLKTDKPNNRSQNKGEIIKDIIKDVSINITTKTKFQNFLNTKGTKISSNRPHRERDKLILESTGSKTVKTKCIIYINKCKWF